jgi:hypothetical protein
MFDTIMRARRNSIHAQGCMDRWAESHIAAGTGPGACCGISRPPGTRTQDADGPLRGPGTGVPTGPVPAGEPVIG